MQYNKKYKDISQKSNKGSCIQFLKNVCLYRINPLQDLLCSKSVFHNVFILMYIMIKHCYRFTFKAISNIEMPLRRKEYPDKKILFLSHLTCEHLCSKENEWI